MRAKIDEVKSANQCFTPVRNQKENGSLMSTLIGGFYFMMSFYRQVPAVDLITNIFHRGGIIHKTETKKGHKNRSDSDCDA